MIATLQIERQLDFICPMMEEPPPIYTLVQKHPNYQFVEIVTEVRGIC